MVMVEIWERTEKEVYESKSQMIINNSNTFLYLIFSLKRSANPLASHSLKTPVVFYSSLLISMKDELQ